VKLNRPFWWKIAGSSICVILATFGFRELLTSDGQDVGWLLFSFAMLACGAFGFALTLISTPIRERVVSIPARIALFGVSVGLLWSLAPGCLNAQFSLAGTSAVLAAGGLTGVAVSFALYKPLMKCSRLGACFLGICALPAGAFCFGVCESCIYMIREFHTRTGVTAGDFRFMPLALGAEYAFLSLISASVVILVPLAILTTFSLRALARSNPMVP
jgi:hypothetical protein